MWLYKRSDLRYYCKESKPISKVIFPYEAISKTRCRMQEIFLVESLTDQRKYLQTTIIPLSKAKLFKAFEAAIWRPCNSHEPFGPQHCVFPWQASNLINAPPAAPTSLPGSSVWNLFFSLAIWQPSNLYRMG